MVSAVRFVQAEAAPPVNGHYSHAVIHKNTIYVSGQLGRGPGMTDAQAGDVTTQARRCLASMRAILQAGGSDLAHLIKVTIYVADMAAWADVNSVYAEVLGVHRPARAVIPVCALHFGALIEIDAVATIPRRTRR